MAPCPRGSCIRKVRRSSGTLRRRSSIVAPGRIPTPSVTTRVGIPSVCDSTVLDHP